MVPQLYTLDTKTSLHANTSMLQHTTQDKMNAVSSAANY